MSDTFIDVPIVTDPAALAQVGIDKLQALLETNGFPGYVPNDGNLEVIQLSSASTLAADVATVAAQVPSAIFRAFGTQLYGVPFNQGVSATVSSTWTLADTLGHTISAGTFVTISDSGFYVQSDVVIAPGSSTATVTLQAVADGTIYNGLSGTIALVDQIDWVLSAVTIGSTAGGADAQDDTDYQNKFSSALSIYHLGVVTAADAAAAVQSDIALNQTGIVVGRATAVDGYNPASASFTVNTSSGSPSLTVTAAPATTVTATQGATITGTGIPGGTTVLSATTSTITMSANASSSNTGITATVGGTSGNQRTLCVFVTDSQGAALSGGSMTALQTWLQGYRELNFVISVVAPSYTTVYVTVQVKVLPGFDAASTAISVKQAVEAYLSPATWGTVTGTSAGANSWLNASSGFATVRFNKLLGLIEAVPGVDYVPNGGMTLGTSPSPTGTADITLTGQAPLPQSNDTTITVTTV